MRCIDFMALTAASSREPYLALMPVTAMWGDLAVGDMSVGLGPGSDKRQYVNFCRIDFAGIRVEGEP